MRVLTGEVEKNRSRASVAPFSRLPLGMHLLHLFVFVNLMSFPRTLMRFIRKRLPGCNKNLQQNAAPLQIIFNLNPRSAGECMDTTSGVARNQQKGGHGAREGRLFPTRGAPLSASERGVNSKGTLTSCLCMASYYYFLVVLVLVLVGVPKNEYETRFAGF